MMPGITSSSCTLHPLFGNAPFAGRRTTMKVRVYHDENLLIIRDARELAAAYATNIMAVYNQYRWRFRRQTQPKSKQWKGLEDGDSWQKGYLKAGSEALREINFWIG